MESTQYVPSTQSLEHKELGFNEPCTAYYQPTNGYPGWDLIIDGVHTNSILEVGFTAPLFKESFAWFRLTYGWNIHIFTLPETGWDYYIWQSIDEQITDDGVTYFTFEEAELACLNKLLQMVKAL
jgi:hypothetical protein